MGLIFTSSSMIQGMGHTLPAFVLSLRAGFQIHEVWYLSVASRRKVPFCQYVTNEALTRFRGPIPSLAIAATPVAHAARSPRSSKD